MIESGSRKKETPNTPFPTKINYHNFLPPTPAIIIGEEDLAFPLADLLWASKVLVWVCGSFTLFALGQMTI